MPDLLTHTDYAAALAAWDDYTGRQGLHWSTAKHYSSLIRTFLRWLESAGIRLQEVTPLQVEEFLDEGCAKLTRVRYRMLKPKTKALYRNLIRRFFGELVIRGITEVNPAAGAGRGSDESPLTLDNLEDRFTLFTQVERQATVDAAAVALLFHDIHFFTEGKGGSLADVALCEATLELGERHGIIPMSWIEGDHGSGPQAAEVAPPGQAEQETAAGDVQEGQAAEQPGDGT